MKTIYVTCLSWLGVGLGMSWVTKTVSVESYFWYNCEINSLGKFSVPRILIVPPISKFLPYSLCVQKEWSNLNSLSSEDPSHPSLPTAWNDSHRQSSPSLRLGTPCPRVPTGRTLALVSLPRVAVFPRHTLVLSQKVPGPEQGRRNAGNSVTCGWQWNDRHQSKPWKKKKDIQLLF